MADRANREFDIIVYGATGYTGRLVAEHLLTRYGVGQSLKWAMAGRSADKLAEVRGLIGAPADLPLIVADAADPASVKAMVERGRAVITTVGPYQLYGDQLVAACAAAGTDYLDLAGESHWIAQKIAAHEETAKTTGARLFFSAGFDSIPFDLGVYYIQENVIAEFGAPAPRVRGRVRGMSGAASGGTLASGQATMQAAEKDKSIIGVLMNPFALTPGFEGPAQPDGMTPHQDEVTGSWVVPFVMAMINSKTVHRSNYLLGHRWGTDFQYCEMLMTSGPDDDAGGGFDMSDTSIKPGDGPTKEERENGWYDILVVAQMADGTVRRAGVKGDMDPGYGSTAKMLAESAICLLMSDVPGGAITSSSLGMPLVQRLHEHAGLTFAMEG